MSVHQCWKRVAAFAVAMLSVPALAADARLPLPGGGTLVLSAPEGWRHVGQPGRTPTIAFTPGAGQAFTVLVSSFGPGAGPTTPAAVRKQVEAAASSAKSQAVEQLLPILELRTPSVQGHYFSATDKAPKAGEFKYLTQGALLVKGTPVAFTILSNGEPATVVEPALRMLGNAKHE